MSVRDRRIELIGAELDRAQRVNVADLALRLEVSTESIRRDLEELEIRGQARRVYGGAVLVRRSSDLPFRDREPIKRREKVKIGRLAAQQVSDGMKIFLGTGTTVVEAAKAIRMRKNLTVFTNSLAVSAELIQESGITLWLLGGKVRPEYQAMYGNDAVEILRSHRFDCALVGATAVEVAHGVMEVGEEEAALHRQAIRQSGKTILIADSSKFGRMGQVVTVGLDEIGAIVTEKPLPERFEAAFAKAGTEVIIP